VSIWGRGCRAFMCRGKGGQGWQHASAVCCAAWRFTDGPITSSTYTVCCLAASAKQSEYMVAPIALAHQVQCNLLMLSLVCINAFCCSLVARPP
jgi:hypothetical protein